MRFWFITVPANVFDASKFVLKWALVGLGAFIVIRLMLDRMGLVSIY